VGDDEMGQKIVQKLSEMKIGPQGVFVEQGRQTSTKTRIIAHQQQLVRIDRETTEHPGPLTSKNLSEFLRKEIKGFDGIILSDYGKGLLTRTLIRTTIRKAREMKKLVMVDPKIKNFFYYKGATVVTPNVAEASAASSISIHDPLSLKRAGQVLLKKLGCKVLVITRGEEGMAIFEPLHDPFLVPTVAKEVYDVTGAGDTVIGTMALALAAGAGVIEAAKLANYAAGIAVGKIGTATVSQEELIKVTRKR
jgi:D-beta-D-heptose 7-phosphate kinase/D-beta-D-heptose 1-phosphate adenosyltransferase